MTSGMVVYMAEVVAVSKAKKLTITLPEDLIATLDGIGRRQNTSRSGAIAHLLRRARQAEIEALMAEGYRAMAEENREDAELFFPAQSEVVLRDEP